MQGLPELLLLLQVSQNFAPDSLQALDLALALIQLTLQGLDAEGELGVERQGGGLVSVVSGGRPGASC